jgi:hypothetical protein
VENPGRPPIPARPNNKNFRSRSINHTKNTNRWILNEAEALARDLAAFALEAGLAQVPAPVESRPRSAGTVKAKRWALPERCL